MTRKDFERLAMYLRQVRPSDSEAFAGWLLAAYAVANACTADNPRFDRQRFLRACGA